MDILPATFIDEFITVAILQIVAVMSPGPDFAIVVQNSLVFGRRVGVYTGIGIAIGVIFHVILAILGIGFLIAETPVLLNGFKVLAAGYLFYMAYGSLTAKKAQDKFGRKVNSQEISASSGFKRGVLTNLLNPKCILFFLTLFTVVVAPITPRFVIASYGLMIFMVTLIWFVTLALCFSNHKIREIFYAYTHWISRVTGVIFLGLGAKLLVDIVFS